MLQSDMRGFTAMSAIHPPEVVLGILSDMFAKFDMLASHYGVSLSLTLSLTLSRRAVRRCSSRSCPPTCSSR